MQAIGPKPEVTKEILKSFMIWLPGVITLCLTLLLFLCSTAVTLCVTSNEIVADPRENSIAEDGSLVQKENFWTDAKAQGTIAE